VLLLCILLAGLPAPAQPATDADVWTAVIAQLRSVTFGQRGELLIIPETLQRWPRLPPMPPSFRESALLKSLTQRNSAPGVIRDVQLPPRTRLGATDSMSKPAASDVSFFDGVNWDSFKKEFPSGMLLRLSLPAFSDDGTRAIIYYQAAGGFDDSAGGYLILEKQPGRWAIIDGFGFWIS
jgi:hypothetical protein